MNLDLIILVFILFIFFGFLFSVVIFLPRLIIKLRANSYDLQIDLREASIIQKCGCANKAFFKNAKDIKNQLTISIDQLTTHVLAGGNLVNIKNGIEELKNHELNISFNVLSAIDLTNRDIKSEVIKSREIKTIELNNISNQNISIDYHLTYMQEFPKSIWSNKTNEDHKNMFKKKLEEFDNSWPDTDPINTESFIRQNIISIDFIEKEIGGIIKNQEFKIIHI